MKTSVQAGVSAVALAVSATAAFSADTNSVSWLDNSISPVANPIYFEDPRITSEVRPIYAYHSLPSTFSFSGGAVPLGGRAQVMAVQLRYALTDRLAIIATKDGYIEFQPAHTLAHKYGWGDLAAGLKYAVVDNKDSQLIVTPGFTVTVPTGSTDVYQDHGSGQENIFVSAEKGFKNLHLTGNIGVVIPNTFDKNTSQLHYSAQVDYYVHQYFIPFAVVNGYTVLSNGRNQGNQSLNAVPLNTEGYDLINFGSCAARGTTQMTAGAGFRTRILKNLDFGAAYEFGIVHPVGIFAGRVTADVIFRF
jgi:hypothetical protein